MVHILQQLYAPAFFVPTIPWHLLLPFLAVFTKIVLQLENVGYGDSVAPPPVVVASFLYRISHVDSSGSFL